MENVIFLTVIKIRAKSLDKELVNRNCAIISASYMLQNCIWETY